VSGEPHGGSVLDEDQQAWVIGNRGRQHVVFCAKCGRPFYSPRLKAATCWGCWYEGEVVQAENMFRPLSDELERRLEVKTSVDQTGGMVMCLRVPVGRKDEKLGRTRRYAYFGRLSENEPGLGLYEDDEDGEPVYDSDSEYGEYHEWSGTFRCGGGWRGTCEWYHHPGLCRVVAEWAAPIIVEFATRGAAT
jgi:hypothetical protein